MSLHAAAVNRLFKYGGRVFPDPDPQMSPEQVKAFYSHIHADLLTAQVEGGEFDGDTQVFSFRRAIGTKG